MIFLFKISRLKLKNTDLVHYINPTNSLIVNIIRLKTRRNNILKVYLYIILSDFKKTSKQARPHNTLNKQKRHENKAFDIA
jgi:hypothetical protein